MNAGLRWDHYQLVVNGRRSTRAWRFRAISLRSA